MPRSLHEILDYADELAEQFEAHDPDLERIQEIEALTGEANTDPDR